MTTNGQKRKYSYPTGVHHNSKDSTGQRFGILTVMERSRTDGKRWWWTCQCDCGNTCEKIVAELRKSVAKGHTPSCGCLTHEARSKARQSHGMTEHPAYAIWRSMKARCLNPRHKAYHNYGGRGIAVCEEWQHSFETFWDDMHETYQSGLDLDRIDNNGPYCKANCRWVERKVNCNNRRRTIRIETPHGVLNSLEFANHYGIAHSTVCYRLKHGITMPELALPPKGK